MDERWFGNAFQMFEATDENHLEFAVVVLREEHILITMRKNGLLASVHILGWDMQDIMATEIVAL